MKWRRLCYPGGWSNDPEALTRAAAGYSDEVDPLCAVELAPLFQALLPALPLADYLSCSWRVKEIP